MRKFVTKSLGFILVIGLMAASLQAQQPVDGDNSYRLAAVNPRFLTPPDTIGCTSGRGVFVAADPDLDGDGKPEVLVTEYRDGGRVLVFEVVGNDKLEYVWGSKRLNPGGFTSLDSPRSVSVGDFDNNGKMEIHFQIGQSQTDSLELAQRGLYIYEFTGNDNDYGSEPIRHIKFEEIEPLYAQADLGAQAEEGLVCEDVDGDGKNELLFLSHLRGDPPQDAANMYILEVESGTFENGDANIRVEFKYTAMGGALEFGEDGYAPVSAAVGDIDNDGLNEIVVLGRVIRDAGESVGFIEVSGVDTYTVGSLVDLGTFNRFAVKAGVEIIDVAGQKAVVIAGGFGSNTGDIFIIENIVSEAFVSPNDVQVLVSDTDFTRWGAMAIGDQDHGSGSDGFEIYVTNVPEINVIEYDGSGPLGLESSYTRYGPIAQFNLDTAYDVSDGLFVSIATFPGMDIDGDGNRDIVVGYKGGCGTSGPVDELQGQEFAVNSYGFFVFEWGDPAQSVPLTLTTSVEDRPGFTIITPDDYHLQQNFPNPFNPETNIEFSLPVDKTVSLKIYNSLGREVRTLVNAEALPQGTHTVRWDARDDQGNQVASGVYIYKLIFGNFSKSQTMTLVR